MKLKICSLNIHKGLSPFNIRPILQEIKELLSGTHAEILCLQEVLGSHDHYKNKYGNDFAEKQFEFLADANWKSHAYGKNAVYTQGDHGNAILSKFDIIENINFDISVGKHEQRGLLYTKLSANENLNIFCYTTHLNLRARDRLLQCNMIVQHILDTWDGTSPLILSGDFNDWGQKLSPLLYDRIGLKSARVSDTSKKLPLELPTFPAVFPILALDRIYTKNVCSVQVDTIRVRKKLRFTDHLPITALIEL